MHHICYPIPGLWQPHYLLDRANHSIKSGYAPKAHSKHPGMLCVCVWRALVHQGSEITCWVHQKDCWTLQQHKEAVRKREGKPFTLGEVFRFKTIHFWGKTIKGQGKRGILLSDCIPKYPFIDGEFQQGVWLMERRGWTQRIWKKSSAKGENHRPNGLGMVKRQQQRPAKHKNDGTEQQQDSLGCQDQKPHGTGQAQVGITGAVYVAGCEGQLLMGT